MRPEFYNQLGAMWAQLVTAFLPLLAFPLLESANLMQPMDCVWSTSFFLPRIPRGTS